MMFDENNSNLPPIPPEETSPSVPEQSINLKSLSYKSLNKRRLLTNKTDVLSAIYEFNSCGCYK